MVSLLIDIVFLVFTVVAGVGTAFWLWEFFLNVRRVPPQQRPAMFSNERLTTFQLYSCWSLVIVPWFAFKYFDVLGWYSLLAWQVYPLACVVLALLMMGIARVLGLAKPAVLPE